MNAMGSVDELNSVIGLLICKLNDEELETLFTAIQHDLFNIGGEISMPGQSFIKEDKISYLEDRIDHFNESVEPLKDFILPGGSEAASVCHMARSIARRAERDVVSLHNLGAGLRHYAAVFEPFIRFAVCRCANHQSTPRS